MRPSVPRPKPASFRAAVVAAFLLVAGHAAPVLARETPAARVSPPTPGIYHLAELHRVEAARLDRSQCFLLQALSPLDLHGPHLPAATSFELSQDFTLAVAERLRRARPEWSVVILPPLPIGAGATGEMGGVYLHSSTVPVDLFQLREFLGNWFLGPAENAHTNLAVISFHLDPQHLKAISDVCDYYVQNYGMAALNVMSYALADSATLAGARDLGVKALGDVPEAGLVFEMLSGGVAETSLMLALHPDAVEPDYKELEPRIATSWDDAVTLVKTFGWPGYIGHPARATAAYGRSLWEYLADRSAALILERVGGSLLTGRPRLEDVIKDEFALREAIRADHRHYERYTRRYNTWLERLAAADKTAQGNKSIEK
jgi:creatinine amidohydrolase